MKILIVTQAVDAEDPILGFFVRWIEEFAKHVERIEVVCLKEGVHAFPGNVRVHSLGKEHDAASRITYARRFLSLVWRLRREYDVVFVHMNPEYIILGSLLWRLRRTPIAFWYNHPHAGVRFRIAAYFSNVIFFTSPYAASAKFIHAVRMPAGIDTDIFKPQSVKCDRQFLYMQGRIMPSKRVHIALEALRLVRKTVRVRLILVGPEDPSYGQKLREQFKDLVASSAVVFAGPKSNSETPALYTAAGLSVNLAAAGHFDKSVLESMACGTPVIVSSPAFSDLIPPEWVVQENDATALAGAIEKLVALPEAEYRLLQDMLRDQVVAKHSLEKLSIQLFHVLQ